MYVSRRKINLFYFSQVLSESHIFGTRPAAGQNSKCQDSKALWQLLSGTGIKLGLRIRIGASGVTVKATKGALGIIQTG